MKNTSPPHLEALTTTSLRANCLSSVKVKHSTFAKVMWAPKIVRLINKYFYRLGVGAVLNRYDSSLSIYSARKDMRLYQNYPENSIFCNFGSGAFKHPRWTNFDYPGQSEYYKSIQGEEDIDYFPIDLCSDGLRLPYSDGTVSLIYCAHTLEHLEESKAIHFLKECSRILKGDAVMRIAIPCTDNDFYFSKVIFSQPNVSAEEKIASLRSSTTHLFTATKILQNDALMQDVLACEFNAEEFVKCAISKRSISNKFDGRNPESHITHWSHDKLASLANEIGFKYYLPLYRGSTTADPFKNIEVFDTTEPHVSLYGEFICE